MGLLFCDRSTQSGGYTRMILVTGASGFIGRHTVRELLSQGHRIIAVTRDPNRSRQLIDDPELEWIECDLGKDTSPVQKAAERSHVLVHLAWEGLPNYLDTFHLTRNLPQDLQLLDRLTTINPALHVLVTGTCLEYGLADGPLHEDQQTAPHTPYGLAKDTLRKSLEHMSKQRGFTLQWLRLFYTFGEGQNERSLLAKLDAAIEEGAKSFDMSAGEQLRDYVAAPQIARIIAQLVKTPKCNGALNVASGTPISIRRLVEEHCRARKSDMKLNLGVYPYPTYEPMAFWGVPEKLRKFGII